MQTKKFLATALILVAIASAFYAGSNGFGYKPILQISTAPTGQYSLSLQGATCSSITQFGIITWTFDRAYECGQFANGDYWVLGPVTIVGITPASVVIDGRTINGSMIDPVFPGDIHTTNKQAFDSSFGGWDSTLNVGRPNGNTISAGNPLVIEPNHSLISSISNASAGVRITDAAILTILDSAPEPNSFRPGYMGSDKTIKYNVRDLDYSMLQSLAPVTGAPSLATAESLFERPWTTWQTVLAGTYASNNMPGYGTQVTARIGNGMLVLNLNYTNAQKETLMIRLVQLGIDYYSVLANTHQYTWRPAGGAGNTGHKLPVVFAATVLNDSNMITLLGKTGDYLWSGNYGPGGNRPPDYIHISEDDQTFYVSDEDIYSQPYELKSDLPQPGGTKTGKVKVTHDSNIVEGIGTNWLSINLANNKFFAVKNDIDAYMTARPITEVVIGSDIHYYPDYVIKSINSNTQLTLNKAYRGDTDQTGNAEYVIARRVWYGHGNTKYRYDTDEFTNEHLGLPEWAPDHALSPNAAGTNWGIAYRSTAGQSFNSITLPALIMDLKELWNHDALFDYTDRYMNVKVGSSRSHSAFAEKMWDTYRANYSCVWTRNNQSDQYSKGHYDCSSCSYNCLSSPYCGDGTCNGNEDSKTCAWDCKTGTECSDGQTKQCGTTDTGECSYGAQTCTAGIWGECIGSIEPTAETTANNNCSDAKDNDCDGKTDAADEECQTAECTVDSQCPAGQTCQNSVCAAECIDEVKLSSNISEWKQGKMTMLALMQKLRQWKAGTGC